MIQIVQLFDREADFQTQRSVETLARGLGDGFDVQVQTIGRGGTYRNAIDAIFSLRRRASHEINIVHAWGKTALLCAACGVASPIIFSPTFPIRARTARWLTAAMSYGNIQAICPSSTVAKFFVERGVAVDRCHIIRPGVDFARISRRRNVALRAKLGFEEFDHVFLAAGESIHSAGHDLAIWATAILNVLDPRHKILIWGRGQLGEKMLRFGQALSPAGLIASAETALGQELEYEELLGVADSILVTCHEHGLTLPIAISMAAGLPIVSVVNYTTGEMLEDRHTALMIPQRSARQLARRMMDLREDPGIQWTVSDMARTEAYEYFAQTRFINDYRAIYTQLAERQKVEVPAPVAGAGLRFHGRA